MTNGIISNVVLTAFLKKLFFSFGESSKFFTLSCDSIGTLNWFCVVISREIVSVKLRKVFSSLKKQFIIIFLVQITFIIGFWFFTPVRCFWMIISASYSMEKIEILILPVDNITTKGILFCHYNIRLFQF